MRDERWREKSEDGLAILIVSPPFPLSTKLRTPFLLTLFGKNAVRVVQPPELNMRIGHASDGAVGLGR